jgi:hypothetical protein
MKYLLCRKIKGSALLLCGVLAGCNQTTGSGSPTAAIPPAPLSDAEIAKAKVALLAILRDPDSAKLSDVRRVPSSQGDYVCGRVNARNGLGGYSRALKFSVAPNGEAAIGGESLSLGIWTSPCWGAVENNQSDWDYGLRELSGNYRRPNPEAQITR